MPSPDVKYRIFLASPGDVPAERKAMEAVVGELNRTLGEDRNASFRLVKWEADVFPSLGDVQEIVNRQVEPYNVFVGLLWKRFGTPTKVADSGTQEEFMRALGQCEKDKRLPVLFYFCERNPPMPTSPDEAEQLMKVATFRQSYPGLYFTYKEPGEFERLVREHLHKALRELLDAHEVGTGASPASAAPPPIPAAPTGPDPSSLEKVRTRYLTRLRNYCHLLPLAAVGGEASTGDEVKLEDVYIALNTTTRKKRDQDGDLEPDASQSRGEKAEPLSAWEAVGEHRRIVLLGDPGAGKSTFVKQWLAEHIDHLLEPGSDPVATEPLPVFLTLRDLIPRLRACKVSHLADQERRKVLAEVLREQVVDDLARHDAQDLADVVREAFTDGRCRLVLDGLDEVPYDLRRRVREVVRAALQRYDLEYLIVTCRVRSYGDEAAQLTGLPSFTLAPLDREQKQQFASSWYEAQVRLNRVTPEDAVTKGGDLAQAALSSQLREISSNPMLLTTMALVHQEGVGLPDERVALYKLAVDVLLRRWRRHNVGEEPDAELNALLKSDRRLRQLVEHLAFEAHRTGRGQNAEALLSRDEALAVLHRPEHLGGSLEDRQLAERFLDYVDRRAGLLAGRGGTETMPETFGFPHRTFQEYLAGCHLMQPRDPAETLRELAAEGDYWSVAVPLGAEEVIHNLRNSNKLLDTAYALCPPDCPDTESGQRGVLWSAAMARLVDRAEIERDTKGAESGPKCLHRLRYHLVEVLRGVLPPTERAEAGNLLAEFDDPRPEVMTVEHMQFCHVPAGSFMMGSPDTDEMAMDREKPLHEVTLSYDYWIGRFPITVAQWTAFVEDSGHELADRDSLRRVLNHPVVGVSWHDAQAFCTWLTERLHQVAAETRDVWAQSGGTDKALWRGLLRKQLRVSLPSEAEWEKAARGDNDIRRYPWGDEITPNALNYRGTEIGRTSAVGCFPEGASPSEAEEMSGNVFEWTRDGYQADLYEQRAGAKVINPDIPQKDNGVVMARGGAFYFNQGPARCASRDYTTPDSHIDIIGFRVIVRPSSGG
ncbi:MAG: SUMF1/EgtB/PvdO family nonheme iron enzyme [Bacteroidota bacterium]